MRSRIILTLALVLVFGVIGGCARSLPERDPDMTSAKIVDARRDPGSLTLMVEDASGSSDAATVWVYEQTEVLKETSSGIREAVANDLVEGARVDIWFDGPIAASYPPQGSADTILILE